MFYVPRGDPSGAYEKVFWWFLDLNQLSTNWPQMLGKKLDELTQIQVNSFWAMSFSFGDFHDLESPGL